MFGINKNYDILENVLITFVGNSFRRSRFNFQLLANAFVLNKRTAAVKLQASVTNKDIYCPSPMKNKVEILPFILPLQPVPANLKL